MDGASSFNEDVCGSWTEADVYNCWSIVTATQLLLHRHVYDSNYSYIN